MSRSGGRAARTRKRDVMLFTWHDGQCAEHHRWGGELLHTFVASGHMVTVRTCTKCGAVRIKRERLARAQPSAAH